MTNEIVALVDKGAGLSYRKHLKSALEILRGAHGRARQPWERALCAYQLGALHWGDLGNGVEARRLFQETVEVANRIPSDAHAVHVRELEANACENLMLLSLSYDEYESWAKRLRALQPDNDILRGHLPTIRDQRERGHSWSDVMLMIATSYYNRHDPARDVGRYGAAKSIYHLILANRIVLRLPRTDWKVAATEYAKLVMRISADCARALERHAEPSVRDPVEFTFIIEEAIALVADYVSENPGDNDVKEDLDRLQQGLKLFREDHALYKAAHAQKPAESAVAMNAPSHLLAAVVMLGAGTGGLWVMYHLLFAQNNRWELLLFLIITFGYVLWYRRYTMVVTGDNPFLLGRQLAFLVFPCFANLTLIALWYFFGSGSTAVLIALPVGWIIARGLQLTIFAHEFTFRDRI